MRDWKLTFWPESGQDESEGHLVIQTKFHGSVVISGQTDRLTPLHAVVSKHVKTHLSQVTTTVRLTYIATVN